MVECCQEMKGALKSNGLFCYFDQRKGAVSDSAENIWKIYLIGTRECRRDGGSLSRQTVERAGI